MRIYDRDACWYCGYRFRWQHTNSTKLRKKTMDHVVPRCELAITGEKLPKNTVPACRDCNEAKADMPLEEFRQRFPFCGYMIVNGGIMFYGEMLRIRAKQMNGHFATMTRAAKYMRKLRHLRLDVRLEAEELIWECIKTEPLRA